YRWRRQWDHGFLQTTASEGKRTCPNLKDRHVPGKEKMMNQMLNRNTLVRTVTSSMDCHIEQMLGGGGQGEVYRCQVAGKAMAVKWYFPHYLLQDSRLRERLETAIASGPPSDCFLWPTELVVATGATEFGYIMPLREERFKNILDMMTG